MGWTKLEGKKVFIKTKSNRFYSGVIQKVIENKQQPENYSIELLDKYSKIVILDRYEIVELKEEE